MTRSGDRAGRVDLLNTRVDILCSVFCRYEYLEGNGDLVRYYNMQ